MSEQEMIESTDDTNTTIMVEDLVSDEEIEEIVQELGVPGRPSKAQKIAFAQIALEKRRLEEQISKLKAASPLAQALGADIPAHGEVVGHSIRTVGDTNIALTLRIAALTSYVDIPCGAMFDSTINNWRAMPRELLLNGSSRGRAWSFYSNPVDGEPYGGVMKGVGRSQHPLSDLDAVIGEIVQAWEDAGFPEDFSVKFAADHQPEVKEVKDAPVQQRERRSPAEIIASMKSGERLTNPSNTDSRETATGNSVVAQRAEQRSRFVRRNAN